MLHHLRRPAAAEAPVEEGGGVLGRHRRGHTQALRRQVRLGGRAVADLDEADVLHLRREYLVELRLVGLEELVEGNGLSGWVQIAHGSPCLEGRALGMDQNVEEFVHLADVAGVDVALILEINRWKNLSTFIFWIWLRTIIHDSQKVFKT